MAKRFFVLNTSCSLLFLHLGLSAAHHHPDIWHASDLVKDHKKLGNAKDHIDFGIFQLIAVGHRPNVDASLAFSSITFGRHGLHHMFPTLDLCLLNDVKEIFWQTCKEFHIEDLANVSNESQSEWGKKRAISTWQSWWGMMRQVARKNSDINNFPYHLFENKK